MEIIQNFGINPLLLAAQIVNFLVILYLLKRFAYKPILEVLQKRQQTITEGHANAKKADEALQKALESEKKLLREAQTETKNMLSQATKQADDIINKAHDKAKQQAEKLIKDTKEQLERDRKETEKQLAIQVTKLATEILEKSLQGFFDEKQQKSVLETAVSSLRGTKQSR